MSDLLAVDPSIVSPGAALFRDDVLIAAARIALKVDTSLNDAERCLAAADAICAWVGAAGGKPDVVAHEWPQIYTAAKSKGDPNGLVHMVGVDLAVDTAYMIAAAMRKARLTIRTFTPAEWIGQLPKATRGSAKASPRGKRILSRLSPTEVDLVPNQHDAIDAVGIGLHALGRLGVRRAYSNGSD